MQGSHHIDMMFVHSCPSTLVVLSALFCLLLPSFHCYVHAADNQLVAADLGEMLAADGDPRIAMGRPRRPDSFLTIDELNQYLAEMRQYYSMLGRPR